MKTLKLLSIIIFIILKKRSGWFSNNIYMMNNIFCSMTLYKLLYNDIWYHIIYLKYANNILTQFFRYLLFYTYEQNRTNFFFKKGIELGFLFHTCNTIVHRSKYLVLITIKVNKFPIIEL